MGKLANKGLYHFVRLFTALWFLYAGLNFFLYPDNQRLGLVPASHDFTVALISSGLFTWVKAIEVVLGITLLMHRFMPLTILGLIPINFVVVYYNWVLEPHTGTFIAGGLTLLFTAYLTWSWRAYFWPLLTFRGKPQHGLKLHLTTIRETGETE
jgi:uncharacterized membrane protein YphA (DoxX/SURF4 family)